MKQAFALIIGLVLTYAGFSQSCLPEGFIFNTQSEIDNFPEIYPGCTEIEGDIQIGNFLGSNFEITNLNGFSAITSIKGRLCIVDCDSLKNLNGLWNLKFIGGKLIIYDNDLLTNLSGLDNVISIGNTVAIGSPSGGNISLLNLSGLERVSKIGGSLSIDNNPSLLSLHGLEKLDSICGQLTIVENPSLKDLTGLVELEYVKSSIYIRGENLLTDLDGLNSLVHTDGEIWIYSNPHLKNLKGLDNLISIGGQFSLINNDSLNSLTGLENLGAESIDDLEISYNALLCDCLIPFVCDYVKIPNGPLEIKENDTGCNSIEEVDSVCLYLSIGEFKSFSEIKVYPNPSSSTITITTPTTPEKNTTLTMIDITGKEVLKFEITQKQNLIDISGLTQGVYFARITNDKAVQVTKFIKSPR